MSKRQGVLIAVFLVGALGVAAWLGRGPREPVYQGKPLSVWLKRMESWDGDTNNPAFVAFQRMGTNAIPALLKVIQSGGPRIQKMIMKINREQSAVRLPFGEPWYQTLAAAYALYAMGTNAAPALPVLTNLLFHSNALITSTVALAGIGSEGIPPLLSALTNQNYRVRHSAASGLALARSDFDVVVPALIERLQDSDSVVRYSAISSLGELHAKPELVVPALTNHFASPDPLHRTVVLMSLGQFEAKAKGSVPTILGALKDNDEGVRQHAAAALKQIDPEAAAKAGVK